MEQYGFTTLNADELKATEFSKSIASFKNENGLAILCLDLPAEPSKHVIVELQSIKQQWQAMQFPLLVLLPQESKLQDIKQKYLAFFPENTSFVIDNNTYTFMDTKFSTLNGEVKLKILDKGYVVDKEYKKLSNMIKQYPSYVGTNKNTYHIKTL